MQKSQPPKEKNSGYRGKMLVQISSMLPQKFLSVIESLIQEGYYHNILELQLELSLMKHW
jgi:hypothetical protein